MQLSKAVAALALITILVTGCNDDFLERIPLDELSIETFFRTENDLLVYNNVFYDYTLDNRESAVLMAHDERFRSRDGSYWFLDGFSDNTAPDQGLFAEVRSGNYEPGGYRFWGYRYWDFLRAINIGLANYDRADIDQSVINKYAGEARFFRAWFYWDKVSKFGDVQFIDRELNLDDEELMGERTNRDLVMARVLEDIELAVAGLPNDWGGTPGRVDKFAALALMARICLFEGTWQKYRGNDGNLWLEKAAAASKRIMDEGGFRLMMTGDSTTAYNAMHRMEDQGGNPEIIHYVDYEPAVRTNNVVNYYPGRSGGATKSMVEDYLCTDGLPISLSPLYQGDGDIETVFINRDPRLRQTVLHPEDKDFYEYAKGDSKPYPRFPGMGGVPTTTGYHIIKTYNVSTDRQSFNQATTDGITFRLAETFLVHAEAMAELGRLDQGVLDMTINQLRARVGMPAMMMDPPMDPRYADLDISSNLVEIRRERRIELFAEGYRYDDIRRWKLGPRLLERPDLGIRWDDAAMARYMGANVRTEDVDGVPYVSPYAGGPFDEPVFEEPKHYLWPIPNSALSENPNLGQNPGW